MLLARFREKRTRGVIQAGREAEEEKKKTC